MGPCLVLHFRTVFLDTDDQVDHVAGRARHARYGIPVVVEAEPREPVDAGGGDHREDGIAGGVAVAELCCRYGVAVRGASPAVRVASVPPRSTVKPRHVVFAGHALRKQLSRLIVRAAIPPTA